LYELVIQHIETDSKTAHAYSLEAYELANRIGDSSLIVKSGRLYGQMKRRVEDIDGALSLYRRILLIAKRNRFVDEEKKLLNSIALAYTFKAEYDLALQFHFQSLDIREKSGKKDEVAVTLNNIGLVYFKLKDYDKALDYYFRCLEVKKEINDVDFLESLYVNIGLCYNQKEEFTKARKFISQGLEVCGNNCSEAILVEAELGLGYSYYSEFRYKSFTKKLDDTVGLLRNAEKHLLHSYQISDKTGNSRFRIENLFNLSRVHSARGDAKKAIDHLLRAESQAMSTGHNQILIDVYKEFSIVYSQLKNFEKASYYQNRYINLKDSVYSEQLIKNIAEVQTQYAERENIATIASNQQVIRQQRDLNIAVVVIAMLAGLLILVLQRSNRTIKRVNAQLSEAKEVIEEQNKQLEGKNKYLDREVEAKTIDLERANQSLKQVNDELDNFIYKTSHDIRGPLASLKGMCNVALMDVQDPVALDYLRKLDSTAERLNTILTRLLIINQINNSKLSITKIDFESIVKDVLLLEKKKGLPQKLRVTQSIESHNSIQSDKELIRIILENLIDNAIKFYNDSERVDSFVQIHIDPLDQGHVRIRVLDNGIGISESNPGKLFRMFFRASERSETGGIGLYIVKTATAKLGGKVGLRTTPEGYTEFYVDFPPTPPSPEDGPDKPSIY
jgi:signal transduction histidine kinase